MDDATLVEAARRGDSAAWAAVYDRYADKLHDHCHRILRDRDEAADALHDAFIAAARNLDQLRDPSRLRPWLYSICRHESLRRARLRSRVELTDELDDVTGVEVDLDQGASAEELQELVWSAAAGLNERDQALLDLNVRQGLEGQDLADAIGTSLNNSYVLMSRLRDQVERSLGALLIARLGRDDCTELDGLLAGWDGRFTPLLRKRVARHVDSCDVCSERRAAALAPMALLAAAPIMPAPAELRDRVLDGIAGGEPGAPVRFTRGGFAVASAHRGRRGLMERVVGAVALVLLLVVGAVAWQQAGDDGQAVAAVGGPSSTATTLDDSPTVPPATAPASPTTTTPLAETKVTTTTTTPKVAVPPANPGAPPATTTPTIVAPPGPAPDTSAPAIGTITSSESEIYVANCGAGDPKTTVIAVSVQDATTVVLQWSGGPLGGSKPMSFSGGKWRATLGPFAGGTGGDPLRYTVRATDAADNSATRSDSIILTVCPG